MEKKKILKKRAVIVLMMAVMMLGSFGLYAQPNWLSISGGVATVTSAGQYDIPDAGINFGGGSANDFRLAVVLEEVSPSAVTIGAPQLSDITRNYPGSHGATIGAAYADVHLPGYYTIGGDAVGGGTGIARYTVNFISDPFLTIGATTKHASEWGPGPISVPYGASVTLAVPIYFEDQWNRIYLAGTQIDRNKSLYTLTQGGSYELQVRDEAAASIHSVNFILDFQGPATIPVTSVSLNKSSTTLTVGGSETLTATVLPSNATDPSVSWSSNAPSVATVNSSGMITAVSVGNATITATTTDGGKTATCAVMVHPVAPTITTHPQSQTLTEGQTLNLSVVATGTGLSYEWKKDGVTIGGAVTASYTKANVQTTDAGVYLCVVTNAGGSVTSNGATITVNVVTIVNAQTPTITGQPQGATYVQNATASAMSVVSSVTDGGVLSYQWYSNTTNSTTGGTAVGGNSASYTPSTATVGTLYYYVVITNTNNGVNGVKAATATSSVATITVNAVTVNAQTPTITGQPQGATYVQNATASAMTVVSSVTDGGTLSYQWYSNTTNSTTGGTAVGGNSASYTPSTATVGTLYYYVVITNTNNGVNGVKTATATSSVATLTVNAVTVNAQTPTITSQPQGTVYIQNATASAMTVVSSVTDGGVLSYQWYSNTVNSTTGGTAVGGNSASYTPSTATVGTLYYYVVITNTNNGVNGNTTAVATSSVATIIVNTSTVPVESVSLGILEKRMSPGETFQLIATITPLHATNHGVTWTSTNANVATVSVTGLVTAVAVGTTQVVVTTTDGGKTDYVTVIVEPGTIAVTGITLNKSALSLTVGDTESLIATVSPANATNKGVVWSTSDASVVSIVNEKLTAVKVGTATVTAKTQDGNFPATCVVTVTAAPVPEYTVTISSNLVAGGVVNPYGAVKVKEGESLTVSIVPNQDYVIEKITLDGVDVAVTTSLVISNVRANRSVVVTFKYQPVANEEVSSSSLKAYALGNGGLKLEAAGGIGRVSLYSPSGALVRVIEVNGVEVVVRSLPRGVYIVITEAPKWNVLKLLVH